MSEKNDYNTFRKNVIGPRDRIDRVENLCVVGMPDVNACIDGVEVWLEFKSPTEPKRAGTPLFGSNHRISQDQINWMLRQHQAGGHCYFLIATNKRWLLVDGWESGLINTMTVGELIDACSWWTSKPVVDPNAWRTLRNALLRR